MTAAALVAQVDRDVASMRPRGLPADDADAGRRDGAARIRFNEAAGTTRG